MTFEIEVDKQKITAGYISRFLSNTQKLGHEKLNLSMYETRLELLERYWDTFQTQQETLLGCPEYAKSDYAKSNIYDQVEEEYLETKAYLRQKIQRLTVLTSTTSEVKATSVRLPKISLPTFSGDYLAWENFRDLFTTLVHEAPNLSDATRLQYLKTSLTGEAAKLLSRVSTTDANYLGAWNKLVNRFENKKVLINHHFNHLLSLKPMNTETAASLKTLLDSTDETRRALENLGRPVEHWDDWFVHLTVQKLTPTLRKDWESTITDRTHIPTFEELNTFLANRISMLDAVTSSNTTSPKSHVSSNKKIALRANTTSAPLQSSNEINKRTKQICMLCKGPHYLGVCPQYKEKTPLQRRDIVRQLNLCDNCLREHPSKACSSVNRCRKCQANHHSTLHLDEVGDQKTTATTVSSSHIQTISHRKIQPVLLATALVRVIAPGGNSIDVRALLDQGSEATFVSEDLVQRLQLPRTKVHIPVMGLGATRCGTARAQVHVQLTSTDCQTSLSVNGVAFVLPQLTRAFSPPQDISGPWPHLQNLQLSDDGSISPHKIDLVIGADLYGEVLLDGLIKGPPGTPVAQNTIFGWVISGKGAVDDRLNELSTSTLHCSLDLTLTDEIRRFWEIEEPFQRQPLTQEEQRCEDEFQQTHYRAEDGRFVVRLPKRSNVPLGNSYSVALRSLYRCETLRLRDHCLNDAYRTFMQEYLDLGHMSPLSSVSNQDCCYLPHHAVWKTDGQSKKIRVVFNASAQTSSGYTLNDCLIPGPRLQQELSHILTRWRKHVIVFTTDIVKMFRQIWVHPEDRPLQSILWRNSADVPIQEYQLNTVTYGTACAPYLAIRCLLQLADEEAERFPEAAEVIKKQTYVDDILAGADSLEEAQKLKDQLQRLLMAGGFQLSKWSSNKPDLIEIDVNSHFLINGSVKTLGLHWYPSSDDFGFKVTLEAPKHLTKRTILSCIAKLFDPLGWLAPVLIKAKIFIQDLWTTKTEWDASLPSSLENSWTKYYENLIRLEEIRIPRWIGITSTSSWELHGFCDASQRAYAAAVYIRVVNSDGKIKTNLLTAKTKLSPIKVISLPRLELCGAVLLARLLRQVEELFQEPTNVYAWTDSQVVLCWLQDHPSRWKTFVGNRTSEIHQLIPRAIWNHVSSSDNAADSASRGITPEALLTNDLWWHGPAWLSQSKDFWPKFISTLPTTAVQEEENSRTLVSLSVTTPTNDIWSLQDRFSSLLRLLRVTAWVLRFTHNSRSSHNERISGPLTAAELDHSRKFWIQTIQQESFAPEISLLRANQKIHKRSTLYHLNPFLDNQGLLRVGGRLEQGTMSYDEKHPFILSAKPHFTKLLVIDAHHRTLHGGPQLIQSFLSRHFWIMRGRNLIKGVTRSCNRCFRYTAKCENPLMGPLPAVRITPARPFLHTGLDYAGPIQLKFKGRGRTTYKGYIAVFVCMATKAIHLEAVNDYTTASFLAAFKRFCSRRGIPATLFSDQATNFRGADAKLQQLFGTASQENQYMAELLANDGTQWKFIPPHSPHFGGLWEAGVKSVKHHLRRIIGDSILTYEEFTTLLAEIEACLNSRPLTPLSSEPDDYSALTPGHFLIGTALKTVPEPSLMEIPVNRLDRWQLLRRLYEQFWRRWSSEYVNQLQQRSKWKTTTQNLTVGELVLLKEDNLPPSKWCLGRVTQVHPGPDGVVRVATIRTANTELRRPVVKLCRLPSE